jgi:F0F1-type ATP synthase membrane subunit c/vacuolar-type H+-ATPase subunit K
MGLTIYLIGFVLAIISAIFCSVVEDKEDLTIKNLIFCILIGIFSWVTVVFALYYISALSKIVLIKAKK